MTDLVFRGQNDQVKTNSVLVAKVFNKEHGKVMRDIANLKCSNDFRAANFGLSSYVNEQNKEFPMYEMTKDGFTFLVMGYTGQKAAEFKEAYINAFNEMEAKLKSQKPALPDLDLKVRFIEWSANFLGVNDAGKLLMARKLAEEYGTQQYLPDYVTSKGQTHSATYLLKAHNCNISASIFNISCHSFGLIKKMERKGKGGTIHTWWALTDEGMEYGENKVSDKCPLQTQIHWYDDRFTEVLDIIRCKYDRLEDKIN